MNIPLEKKWERTYNVLKRRNTYDQQTQTYAKLNHTIKEIQNKNIRYHFSSIKLANIYKNENYSSLARMGRNGSSHLLGGNANK